MALAAGFVTLFSAVCLFVLSCLFRKKNITETVLLPFAFIFLAAAAGACLWGVSEVRYEKALHRVSGSVDLTLVVTEEQTVSRSGTVWYTAEAEEGGLAGFRVMFPDRSGLNLEEYDKIRGRFEPLSWDDSGSSDRADNILCRLTLDKSVGYDVMKTKDKPFGYRLIALRSYIKGTLSKYLSEFSGFACGMMTGDTGGLSSAEYNALSRAGLLHATAVSGLHVSMLCSMLLFFLKPIKKPVVKTLVCGGILFLLCGVCGFSPSAVRATLMAVFSFLPEFYPGMRVRYEPLNGLGLSALLILMLNPFVVGSASFLLSFSATLGILVLSRPITERISTFVFRKLSYIPGRIAESFIGCFAVSVSSFVFTSPFLLLLFGKVLPLAIVSNLLVFFMFPVVFCFCTFLLLFSAVPGLSFLCKVSAIPIKIGVHYIMSVAQNIASFSFASFDIEGNKIWFGLLLLLIAAFAVCILLFSKKTRKKKQKKTVTVLASVSVLLSAAVFVFLFLVSLSALSGTDAKAEPEIQFLNVGQGSCVVIRYEDTTVVYDCGGTISPAKNAEEWLRKSGADDIDWLVVSHLHDDHANGVAALCEKYPVKNIVFPEAEGEAEIESAVRNAAEKYDIAVSELSEDMTVPAGEMDLKLFTKHIDPEADDQNENCLVLKLDYGEFTALFTGDITAAAEKRLLDGYGAFSVDLLSVPHHGSLYSSSEEFLFRLAPSVSVISVGEGNLYGHPANEVVSRLLGYGSVYMTKDSGTVTVTTDGEKFSVVTER